MDQSPDAAGRNVSQESIIRRIHALPNVELAKQGYLLRSKRSMRKRRTPQRHGEARAAHPRDEAARVVRASGFAVGPAEQREYERADPRVLAQGHRDHGPPVAYECDRGRAQQSPAPNPRLPDAERSAQETPRQGVSLFQELMSPTAQASQVHIRRNSKFERRSECAFKIQARKVCVRVTVPSGGVARLSRESADWQTAR